VVSGDRPPRPTPYRVAHRECVGDHRHGVALALLPTPVERVSVAGPAVGPGPLAKSIARAVARAGAIADA
jgi:hypothetical protein